MAEQMVIVCDVCGAPATASVSIAVHGGGSRDGQKSTKDLCDTHLSELLSNARKPKRGRRRASVVGAAAAPSAPAPRRRGRPPKSGAGSATPRRRGRPRKASSDGSSPTPTG
jgi:hypothetical protein